MKSAKLCGVLLVLVLSVFPKSAVPQTCDDALAKCKAITDAMQRVQCYDQLAGGSAAPASESPAPGTTMVDPKTGITLAYIPAGTFTMGSPESEEGRDRKETQHEVTLSQPFWMGTTEVTNAQYRRFVEATGHRKPKYADDSRFNALDQPVVGVSWDDAVAYASWAGMSLPTNAQWEYAARAGTTTVYWSGDSESDLARVGWYRGNSDSGLPHAVGEKPANAWGVHDVHGNVWEWVADWYGRYSDSSQTDPTGPPTDPGGSGRVLRGGSDDAAHMARAASRGLDDPEDRGSRYGFRVVKKIPTSGTDSRLPSAIERGAAAFENHACGVCHSVDGTAKVGPTLKGKWGAQEKLADGSTVLVDAAYIAESIRAPNAKVVAGFPPACVRSAPVPDEEVESLTRYIQSLAN